MVVNTHTHTSISVSISISISVSVSISISIRTLNACPAVPRVFGHFGAKSYQPSEAPDQGTKGCM